MADLGMEISNIDSGFMGINSRKFGPCFAEFKYLSLLYPHSKVLVLQ